MQNNVQLSPGKGGTSEEHMLHAQCSRGLESSPGIQKNGMRVGFDSE